MHVEQVHENSFKYLICNIIPNTGKLFSSAKYCFIKIFIIPVLYDSSRLFLEKNSFNSAAIFKLPNPVS